MVQSYSQLLTNFNLLAAGGALYEETHNKLEKHLRTFRTTYSNEIDKNIKVFAVLRIKCTTYQR